MAAENMTVYIILGLLAHEASSGYGLKKKIDRTISQFWDVGYGQLYPTLKRLEQEGAVTGTPAPSAKGPDKIVYAITDAGRKRLADWLSLPEEREYVRYELLLKLFFGKLSSPTENIRRIEAFRRQHAADLQQIKLFKANLERVIDESPDHLYYYLAVLFGEHVYQAYLEWAGQAVRLIEKNSLSDGKETEYEPSENP